MAMFGQAPTGTILGTVNDESGAVVPDVTLTITNKATGVSRSVTTNAEGTFSAPALPAGQYELRAEVKGFKTVVRQAEVEVGRSTTVDIPLSIGSSKEVVTVEAATAQINYENHEIQGVIGRDTIQELPMNGRSFMELATLEPGVTISPGSTAQFNTLFTVSVLGGGNRTLFTVDGGNISDNIDVGGGISSMNFSMDTVQEFQISTVNFDLATGISAGGAINIVTRSGSNDLHGSAYFFYRDHNMAAYPGLQRDALDPNPFFVRKNPGAWLGGPLKKNKLFFFFNYEYMDQVEAITVQNTTPSFAALQGTYGSPYVGKQLSLRLDYHVSDKHNLFLRYSHDGNDGFSQSLEFGDPSNWAHNTNWADQSIIGLTSTLTPNVVNDIRFQYNYWNNKNTQATASDCSDPCVAGSLPNIFTVVGSNSPAIGPNFNAPQARNTRRFEVVEALTWQKGSHRFKFGGDLNPTRSNGLWGFCTPLCVGAFAPEYIAGAVEPVAGPAVTHFLFPTVINATGGVIPLTSDASVLNLPVFLYPSSIFSGIGAGAVSTPAPYGYSQNENFDQFRAYFQDTWKITKSFTFNYGLGWNAQTGFYNSNLSKPQFLAPLLGTGPNNLGPTVNNTKEFQPAFGFAWSPFHDNKTVIRGGAGIYWDSTPGYYKLREAPSIGPVGDGRSTLAGSEFTNTYPGVLDLGTGQPLLPGQNFQLSQLYNLTVGQFLNIVNAQLPGIEAQIAPPNPQRSGPYTVSGIDVTKQGVEIYPTHFPLARSYQTSIGIQRDLGHSLTLTADYARRQGENTSLSEIDLNHSNYYVNGVPNPVIPTCTPAQQFVTTAECSTGSITFWEDQGRAIYEGMLVKVTGRPHKRLTLVGSYALQRATTETVWNVLNWAQGYGQYLPHNDLNIAGTWSLPWGFQLSLNSSIISSTPTNANIATIELPGVDVSGDQSLPGLAYNSLNTGTGKSQLANLVNQFNTNYAGKTDAQGAPIPRLILPGNYSLGAPVFSQDLKLSKIFTYRERYHLEVRGEMFNALNISNITGQSFTLDTVAAPGTPQTFAFGQPTARVGQSLGSGGPRAVQVGARFSF
ncbi:MAG: carboxypeptidase regulatory-like domain-containing protein [Bryobacteraceae bacterium]